MKKIKNLSVFILCFFIGFSNLSFANQNGMTLEDAYHLALKRSEDLQIQEEQVVQAEEKLSQSKGALFPTINGVGTFQKQDSSASAPTAPTTQNTVKLTADQPLFRGFREFAALRQQKKGLQSSEALRDQAKVQLFTDVSQAYYNLMILFHNINILKHQIEVNDKRFNELKSFRKIGRSRESDVLALEASIAALEASIESTRSQTEVAWGVFSFLTGLTDRPQLADDEEVPSQLKPVSEFLSTVDARPDLKALEIAAMSSEEGIAIARGGHLPSLDLLGNYYFDRPGVLAPVKWDVSLALIFPIFQGGVVMSQVRQAASIYNQAEILYQKTKRQTIVTIEQLYNQVQIEYLQRQKQDKASDLALKNYEAQLKDSRLGLVTNIDVLTALSNAQDSLLLSNQVHYQTKVDYLKLLAATLERPKK